MKRVSSPPSPARVPAATVPLACSCDELQRAQRRLDALAGQCSERLERLSQAFEQLPAAASFDPFAVAAPAAGRVGSAADAQAVRRNHRARPSDPGSRAATPLPLPAVGGAATTQQPAGGSRAGASAQAGMLAADAGRVDHSSVTSLTGWLGSLGQLAALGGEQVALLMQRHAATPAVIGLDAVMAGARALGRRPGPQLAAPPPRDAAGVLDAELGTALSRGAKALAGSSGQGAALPPGLAQGLAEALAGADSTIEPPLPARSGGARSSVALSAPQLLEQLLSQGQGNVVAGVFGASSQHALPPRQPAPRAGSRLVGPLPTVAQGKAPAQAPDAPAADALASPDLGEAVAQQINRLLLDQAWLRGVDLK